MRTLVALAVAASAVVGLAAPAFASDRLSDAAFIKAARCAGLAGEDSQFDELLKANKRGRAAFVMDKAMTAKDAAEREVRKAGDGRKAQIEAELSGACAALAS